MRSFVIAMLSGCMLALALPAEAGPRDHRSGPSSGRDHRASSPSTAQGGVVVGPGKSTGTAQGGVTVGSGPKKKPEKCIRSVVGGPCVSAREAKGYARKYLGPFYPR